MMAEALIRERYSNREEWLKGREKGIGASEAAIVLGISNWQSNIDLWKLKCGLVKHKDEPNEAMALGNRLEPAIRAIYAATNTNKRLEYHQFDILHMDGEDAFITATLDGEITDENDRFGVLEVKSCTVSSRAVWSMWDNQVPQHYYAQILHQMKATDAEFVDLIAYLINGRTKDGQVRTYHFERKDCVDDIAHVVQKEREFWKHVKNRTQPTAILPEI